MAEPARQSTCACRYVVQERIGAGGVGVVYRGLEPLSGKQVAIKVLKPSLAGDSRQARRLLREARAVNSIRHGGIVDVFGFGQTPDGRHYLVMEYLEGQPLEVLLLRERTLGLEPALRILEEVLDALAAAHRAGVVHRDLKPSNIFLVEQPDGSRRVKLLDFGSARVSAPQQPAREVPPPRPGRVHGTPEYMAPEQVRGEAVGPRTDLYAVGVLAFRMLTGTVPFRGGSSWRVMVAQVREPPPEPSSLRPGLPAALEALILRLLAKEARQRPTSAQAVREELRELREALREAALAPVASAPSPREAPARLGPLSWLAAAGGGMLLGLGLALGAL